MSKSYQRPQWLKIVGVPIKISARPHRRKINLNIYFYPYCRYFYYFLNTIDYKNKTGGFIIILGICGSPRKQSTDYVLNEALKMLEDRGFEIEFFGVRGKNISPCRHCDYCIREGECVIKDDMYEVYPLITAADGIIMATPIYNGGISAQLKAIMDRCRALGAVDFDFLRYKIGMAITVGGDRIGGQELAIQQIFTFYILTGAIPVSGGAFGANLGANFWSQDTLEGVKQDEQGFRSLRKTVKRFGTFLENVEFKNKK